MWWDNFQIEGEIIKINKLVTTLTYWLSLFHYIITSQYVSMWTSNQTVGSKVASWVM